MGKRQQLSLYASVLTIGLLSSATEVCAYTTEDLYNQYSVPYECSISQDSLDTISAYENAKSYVARFSNLLSLKPDLTTVAAQASALEDNCATLKQSLDSGYYLTYDEIISLENEYLDTCTQLEQMECALNQESVDLQLSIPKIPSASVYNEALTEKETYIKQNYLGDLSFIEPVNNFGSISYDTNEFVVYTNTWGEDVYSIYNAHCIDVQEIDGEYLLVLEIGDSVKMTYKGILQSKIKIDDYIAQGDLIGLAGDSLSIQLVLDNTPVNFSKEGTTK